MTSIQRRQPVDWFRILSELRRCGLSQCEVARKLSVSRNRVKHWAMGSTPGYEDGRALLMLWRRASLAQRKLSAKGHGIGAPSRHDDNGHPSQR